jgi:ABC-type cobalamin transport system ATPase subunit
LKFWNLKVLKSSWQLAAGDWQFEVRLNFEVLEFEWQLISESQIIIEHEQPVASCQ